MNTIGDEMISNTGNVFTILPVRARFELDDPFFDDGNFDRSLFYKYDSAGVDGSAIDPVQRGYDDTGSNLICSVIGCSEIFQRLSEFEGHYFSCHMHECSVCNRSFNSDRLLSIHISERHDSFFKVMAQKKPSYVCLVDGCESVSSSDRERKDHLTSFHLFPQSFDFHEPFKFHSNGRLETIREKKAGKYKAKRSTANADATRDSLADDGAIPATDYPHCSGLTSFCVELPVSESLSMNVANEAGCDVAVKTDMISTLASTSRHHQVEKSVRSAPCRNLLRGGKCPFGSKCFFSHTNLGKSQVLLASDSSYGGASDSSQDVDTMIADDELGDLSAQLKHTLRIAVPNSISFGRRRRKGW